MVDRVNGTFDNGDVLSDLARLMIVIREGLRAAQSVDHRIRSRGNIYFYLDESEEFWIGKGFNVSAGEQRKEFSLGIFINQPSVLVLNLEDLQRNYPRRTFNLANNNFIQSQVTDQILAVQNFVLREYPNLL
jgi:hypothetical protein